MKALCGVLLLVSGTAAYAQTEAPGLRRHHVTLAAGINWSGGYDIGSSTAQLRGNGFGTTPPMVPLFEADARITPTPSPEFRVGVALTRTVAVEAGVVVSHPRIAFGISNDAEAPAQQLLGEQLQQYLVDGAVTWQLPWHSGRLAPFALGGAGYLRQLHEDRMLGESGQVYYAGGGARYWLTGTSRSRSLGVRGDFRINIRQNGIDFENTQRTYPSLTLSIFLGL